MKTCKYQFSATAGDCKEQVNTSHNEEYCIFHAPKDKKGISVEEFNKLIFEKIKKKDFSFEGYVFPGDIDFQKVEFSKMANFYKVRFLGEVSFANAQFSGAASFYETQFSGYANFTDALFSRYARFANAQFSGEAHFCRTLFKGEQADFGLITLSGKLVFASTKFYENCRFTFTEPRFDLQEDKQCLLIFERIQFNPYLTYFENIKTPKDNQRADNTSIGVLFRYCQLKDVYFSNCHMSNFSFYKSSFDEARFISSIWGEKEKEKLVLGITYTRKSIIFEESLFKKKNDSSHANVNFSEEFNIKDLTKYEHIANLYSRMKTALDRTKNYQAGGGFFFNQLEMQRLHATTWGRKTAYYLYKIFAGYGEKPFWSLWWLIIFSALFAPLHLLNGLQVGGATPINYTFARNLEDLKSVFSWQFVGDFFTAFFYSLYRIIPVSYFPKTPTSMTPIGLYDLLLSLFSTLVMILMLSFIIIGLKRRFRRF